MFKIFKSINYIYYIVASGYLLALTGDLVLTWSSPVIPKLYSTNIEENPLGRPITKTEESWIGSLHYVGALFGTILFVYFIDKFGRKPVLLALALPHITAFLIFAFSKNIELYYIGRILNGISLSAVYTILPMYIAEIAANSNRGILLVTFNIFASIGDLLPYIIGPYTSIMTMNLIFTIFPILFIISFSILSIESPYYYAKKRNYGLVEETLTKLRNNPSIIMSEINEIKDEIAAESVGNFWATFKLKHVLKGFVISLLLNSLQQLSGIGAILAYTQPIFLQANTNISSDISSVIVGIVLFLSSCCCTLFIDRQGRKFLLISSSIGMTLSHFCLGLYFFLSDHYDINTKVMSFISIVCVVIYVGAFNLGFGPLPLTITSEILPSNVKFYIATISNCSCWICGFFVTNYYINLCDTIGRGETFWLFAIISLCSLIFSIFVVPETKGKSFQEIQELLKK